MQNIDLDDLPVEEADTLPADPSVRNFSFAVVDGKLYFRENSRMDPVSVSATAEQRIRGLIGIRDCVRKLIEYQTEDYPEAIIQAEQTRLNALYDSFAEKYGRINSRANSSAYQKERMVFFMSILQTTELKKYYGAKPNITRALDGVTLSIEKGEFVAIVGTSGSGKSTLLNMIGGLDVPTSGKVIVDGRELSTLKDEQLTIFRRRKIGFIFQNYNLVPVLNVYENIVLPVELDGNKVDKKFMKEVVQMLGLEDKLNNMPNNLSGGQQQRVAIARALVSKPAIVLADEPTGNLDSKTSADVLGLLKTTSQKFHQTLVMITHNSEIAQLADRIIRIEDGKIVQ